LSKKLGDFWEYYINDVEIEKVYHRMYNRIPIETQEEINVKIDDFIKSLMRTEGYSKKQTIVKFQNRIMNFFGVNKYYTYLVNNHLTSFIHIGKDMSKADELITVITKDNINTSDIITLYPQFKDTYKVFLLSYMYANDRISKKQYVDDMVKLCGKPILNSPLVGSTYIARIGYIRNYVYSIFYTNFTGVSNYNLWVGYTEANPIKPHQRPKMHDTFRVTLDTEEKISYLVDVINSGINYKVAFCKKFVNKHNIMVLMEKLTAECKKTKITTSLKQKIGSSVEQFDINEIKDLDDFCLTLRSLNKSHANRIARKYKTSCEGYIAYKGL